MEARFWFEDPRAVGVGIELFEIDDLERIASDKGGFALVGAGKDAGRGCYQ